MRAGEPSKRLCAWIWGVQGYQGKGKNKTCREMGRTGLPGKREVQGQLGNEQCRTSKGTRTYTALQHTWGHHARRDRWRWRQEREQRNLS